MLLEFVETCSFCVVNMFIILYFIAHCSVIELSAKVPDLWFEGCSFDSWQYQ